jgi:hypothetical protein
MLVIVPIWDSLAFGLRGAVVRLHGKCRMPTVKKSNSHIRILLGCVMDLVREGMRSWTVFAVMLLVSWLIGRVHVDRMVF